MHTVFELDYFLNGQVLYPAGVPVPCTEHTAQLVKDGVVGQLVQDPEPDPKSS